MKKIDVKSGLRQICNTRHNLLSGLWTSGRSLLETVMLPKLCLSTKQENLSNRIGKPPQRHKDCPWTDNCIHLHPNTRLYCIVLLQSRVSESKSLSTAAVNGLNESILLYTSKYFVLLSSNCLISCGVQQSKISDSFDWLCDTNTGICQTFWKKLQFEESFQSW